ncbi:MAG: formate dehydrogenase accessory sulfurtransferase FdhD [Caulobacteraceae bacterium]
MASHAPPSPVETHPAQLWRRAEGLSEAITRDLADERAIALSYDSRPYVVVMGTPADVEDLAVGFTVTERIAPFEAIERVILSSTEEGLLADVLLSPSAGHALSRARRRTLEARSSCGLCGVESLKEAVRPIAAVGEGPRIARGAIQAALAALEGGQSLGRQTRATHAAAWADPSGAVRLVREDVGRHNALDKLIGAALRAGLEPADAFIVVTSRLSYEMVDKTAAAGVAVLAAISAPTALAIRQATAAGMTLIALAREDGHAVFTRPERIVER